MSRKKKSRNPINRENGKLGAGQHTPEGIENSKWNNFKHGGRSKVIFAPWEDFNEFRDHCLTYIQGYNPYDLLEMDIIMDVAGLKWRMKRFAFNEIDAYEENGHDLDKLLKQLNWISLYENRASLQEARKLKEFRKVRDERLSNLKDSMPHYELEELRAKFTSMLHRVETQDESRSWEDVNWREIAPYIVTEMERRGFLKTSIPSETQPDANGIPYELEAYIQWLQDQQATRHKAHLDDVMMAIDGFPSKAPAETEPSPPGEGRVMGPNPPVPTAQGGTDGRDGLGSPAYLEDQPSSEGGSPLIQKEACFPSNVHNADKPQPESDFAPSIQQVLAHEAEKFLQKFGRPKNPAPKPGGKRQKQIH